MSDILSLGTATSRAAPAVTVVLAVHHDHGYLSPAIDSVLRQTFTDWEMLLVVNGGNGALAARLADVADARVRVVSLRLGQLPFALNVGIEMAQGRYIARMDGDDICHPERFARQVAFLDANPGIAAVGSNVRFINGAGQLLKQHAMKTDPEAIHRALPFTCELFHPTVMARRETLLSASGYAYGTYAEDWDLWLRLRRQGARFANLEAALLDYRVHDEQMTGLANQRRNAAYTLTMMLREAIMTGEWRFLAGMTRYGGLALARAIYRGVFPRSPASATADE